MKSERGSFPFDVNKALAGDPIQYVNHGYLFDCTFLYQCENYGGKQDEARVRIGSNEIYARFEFLRMKG